MGGRCTTGNKGRRIGDRGSKFHADGTCQMDTVHPTSVPCTSITQETLSSHRTGSGAPERGGHHAGNAVENQRVTPTRITFCNLPVLSLLTPEHLYSILRSDSVRAADPGRSKVCIGTGIAALTISNAENRTRSQRCQRHQSGQPFRRPAGRFSRGSCRMWFVFAGRPPMAGGCAPATGTASTAGGRSAASAAVR